MIDNEVKSQYSKIFRKQDWSLFKEIADYYFRKGATLKSRDIESRLPHKLMVRNIQKRLFIGIAAELAVKAFYLKNGYYINKPKSSQQHPGVMFRMDTFNDDYLNSGDSFTLATLIDNLHNVSALNHLNEIKHALTILRIFRNKEGHVVTRKHTYNPKTYRDIESGVIHFYQEAFSENLKFNISMESKEQGHFRKKMTDM